MPETTLYLVRHGETDWNQSRRIQGHLDSALTALGRQQAVASGKRLRGLGIEAIMTSDLGRARETAACIAEPLGLAASIDPRLRERGFGELEGSTLDEAINRYGDGAIHSIYHDSNYAQLGVESIAACAARLAAAVEDFVSQHPGKTIAAVTHGGSLGCLFRHAIGLPLDSPRRFELRNCAINRFLIRDDGWHVDLWGDIAHLAEPALDEQTADASAP